MESTQAVKQRFEIIGNDPGLNRAIEKSIRVAPTDISVLVTGESVLVKKVYPKSFTHFRIVNTLNISLLTVVQYLKARLTVNFSVTKKEPLQVQLKREMVIFKKPMAVQSFLMKLANYL